MHNDHAPITRNSRPQGGGWRVQWGPTLRMVLLLALGAMLTVKAVTGGVLLYVNGLYTGLIFAAGVATVVIGYVAGLDWLARRDARPTRHLHLGEGDHAHATGRAEAVAFALLAVPLLLGLLVPARPLGAAALDGRGEDASAASGQLRSLTALSADSSRWTLLDWAAALAQTPDPRTLSGKPVSLVGFVSRAGEGEFVLSRFVVVCCVADGNAVSLPVRGGGAYGRDAWVRVTGTLAFTPGGKAEPYIAATAAEPVPVPGQPYLYP